MKGFLLSLVTSVFLTTCLVVGAAADEPLKTFRHEGVRFILSKVDSGTYSLSISVPEGASPKAFVLENPGRVVVDLTNHRALRNFESAVSGGGAVQRVRIGSHPNMMRIVVDLTAEAKPALDIVSKGSEFRIRFAASAGGLTVAPRDTTEQEPAPTPVIEARPSESKATAAPLETSLSATGPSATGPGEQSSTEQTPTLLHARREAVVEPPRTPTSRPTQQPISTPTPVPVEKTPTPATEARQTAQLPSGAQLQDIRFDFLGANKTPVVRLVLSNRPVFEVIRRSAEEYEFVFSGLDVPPKHLLLPRFPPQDFQGFTHVTCEPAPEESRKIRVRVGIGSGYRLQYLPRDNEIWLKVNEKAEG